MLGFLIRIPYRFITDRIYPDFTNVIWELLAYIDVNIDIQLIDCSFVY